MITTVATETLQAIAVYASFGTQPALRGVTAQFQRGRVTALLGPNGAGKSTLLACLAGLRAPDSGQVSLGGVNVMALERMDRARRIGLLPQSPEVHWDIDVATLVGLGRLPHKGRWGETPDDLAAITHAMAATDVERLAARTANQLSGGERGRVLLARVLAGEPQWLLADEPLANLDPAHQLDVRDLLRQVAQRGAGVVVVLHDLSLAARVADDVILLRDGQVVAHGASDAVLCADQLRATFGIEAHVGIAGDNDRFVLPLRRSLQQ
jgi:iron complex transport system ATP-binding protein